MLFDCPTHLTGEAAAEWGRIVPELERLGRLNMADRAAIAGYCSTWKTYLEAAARVEDSGLCIKTKSGNIIPNPFLGVRNTALKMLKQFASELGLTPRARGVVTPKEKTGDDRPPGLDS